MTGTTGIEVAEPNERTSLLNKNGTDPNNSSSQDSNESVEGRSGDHDVGNGNRNGSVVGDTMKSGANGNGDEEAGKVVEGENPLFEGNEEMMKKMYLLFPAVALGIMLAAADQTIIVSSYGRIGSDLNALNNTSWIATAYFLTLTSFQPLYGKLSDIFGRKAALLFAYSVFGLGCLFCGLARNMEQLIAARAFAGIGGGGMTTVVSILVSDIIPLRQRGSWQGYMNIVFISGSSLGAALGGILADSIGWRWSFLGQFPLTIVASLVVYFILDLPIVEDSHWKEKFKKIDFLGAFSLIIALFVLLVGLDRGSNVAWSDNITIAFCVASVPLLALFILIELRIASNPFAPGRLIFHRSLFASYMSNFLIMGANMGLTFYVPLYFQAVDGMTASGASLRLIPVLICSLAGSLVGGRIMQSTGKYYWLTICSLCFSVIGSLLVFLFSGPLLSFSWGLTIGLGIGSFGGGSMITTTLINIIASADPKDQASATACSYLFRSLGSAVGVSWSSTVVQQVLRTQLSKRLGSEGNADEIVDRVRQSLDFIKTLEPNVREIVAGCYQKATNASFGVSVVIVCAALISVCFIKEQKLSK